MPTYEYSCSSCGKIFEVFQNMGDDPVKDCPSCGEGVKRLISGGGGFIMKGQNSYKVPSCGKEQPCCATDKCAMADHCH